MVTIAEQLQQNSHRKIFVRKYFVIVFIVRNALLSWSMIFLSNKTYFSRWLWLLNNFNKTFIKYFLSENIFSPCFLSEMFLRAPKLNFLAIKFILLAGHDCWKSLLKLHYEYNTTDEKIHVKLNKLIQKLITVFHLIWIHFQEAIPLNQWHVLWCTIFHYRSASIWWIHLKPKTNE